MNILFSYFINFIGWWEKRRGNPIAKFVFHDKELTEDLQNVARNVNQHIAAHIADPANSQLKDFLAQARLARENHDKKEPGDFEKFLKRGLMNINHQINILFAEGNEQINADSIERLKALRQANNTVIDSLRNYDPETTVEAESSNAPPSPTRWWRGLLIRCDA